MKRIWFTVIWLTVALLGCNEQAPRENPILTRAKQGDAQAMFQVGCAHLSTSGEDIVKPNEKRQPAFWLRKAAEKGHVGAMWYLCGVGGVSNEEKVLWLKKGAELGSEACVIELMNGYRFAKYGLPRDTGAAIYWELKRGELYLKRDRKSPEETRSSLAEWEQRYRKENHYDGPIRPLP